MLISSGLPAVQESENVRADLEVCPDKAEFKALQCQLKTLHDLLTQQDWLWRRCRGRWRQRRPKTRWAQAVCDEAVVFATQRTADVVWHTVAPFTQGSYSPGFSVGSAVAPGTQPSLTAFQYVRTWCTSKQVLIFCKICPAVHRLAALCGRVLVIAALLPKIAGATGKPAACLSMWLTGCVVHAGVLTAGCTSVLMGTSLGVHIRPCVTLCHSSGYMLTALPAPAASGRAAQAGRGGAAHGHAVCPAAVPPAHVSQQL